MRTLQLSVHDLPDDCTGYVIVGSPFMATLPITAPYQ